MPRLGLCPPCNVQQAVERPLTGSIQPYQTRGGAGHIVPFSKHAAGPVGSNPPPMATRQAGSAESLCPRNRWRWERMVSTEG